MATSSARAWLAGERNEPWVGASALPRLLVLGAIAALLVRLVWLWRYGHVIENQGVAYARVAESLLAGEGYIGILGDRYTLQGPLFPALIALLAPLAGGAEAAARLISCLAGTALIWPAYSITATLSDRRRAGLIAAGLFASHGVAIGFSAATYGEALFLFLLFASVALMLRAAKSGGWSAAGAGAVFGLAYLVRPETIAYALLSALFILGYAYVRAKPMAGPARSCVVLLLVFGAVVSPYVTWLSVNSGYFRLEGKSVYNSLVNEGMANGQSFAQAARSITDDLQPLGADMFANQFAMPRVEPSGLVAALGTAFDSPVARGFSAVAMWVTDPHSGGILLSVLAAFGCLAAFLGVREKLLPGFLFCMTAGYVGLILAVRFFEWDRYIYPLTYFALLWAALGISALVTATGQICMVLGGSVRAQIWAKLATITILMGAVSVGSLSARYAPLFQESHMPWAEQLKAAGLWIRQHADGRPLIMGVSAVVPYYAGGALAYLPWAEEDDAIRYIRQRAPQFIVLRTAEADSAPYIDDWMTRGVPEPCAEEAQRFDEGSAGELVIYRWRCGNDAL